MKTIKAKKLNWIQVKPEIYENFAFESEISVLKMNDNKPAKYRITQIGNNIISEFYVGYMGMGLKHWCQDIDEAKEVCQKHYDSIINKNINWS